MPKLKGCPCVAFLPFCPLTLKALKPKPYPDEPKTLGEHLKKSRCELQLFQKQVALRLGVNESTVLNWENNACSPAIRFIPRIIAFLSYDPYPALTSLI